MKLLNTLRFLGAIACLVTITRSEADPVVLRARQFAPLRLYVGSLRPVPGGPLRFLHRDLWEWEPGISSDPHAQSFGLFGRSYEWRTGSAAFRYEPSLMPAATMDDFQSGLQFVLANRLKMDWQLGGGVRVYVSERAYFYRHNQPGSLWLDGYYANPAFENRLTAGVEFPLGGNGIKARLPVHLQQRFYSNCEGGYYSGRLRNWLWVGPEVSFPVSTNTELVASYTSETVISSRTGRWFILDGLLDGVAELTMKVKL